MGGDGGAGEEMREALEIGEETVEEVEDWVVVLHDLSRSE